MRTIVMMGLGLLCWSSPAGAKVFHSRQGAFKLAFPKADQIERRHVYLQPQQIQAVEKECACKLHSKLLTVYVGKLRGQVLGYAYIDSHRVRTLPETFMLVLKPDGSVAAVHILAFHEPPEYQPPSRWLAQFVGHDPKRAQARSIAGIAGATLSANAVTRATWRLLSVHRALGLSGAQQRQGQANAAPTGGQRAN